MRELLIKRRGFRCAAVIENGCETGYHILYEKAAAVCRLLPREGRQSIAVFLPNGSGFIAAFFGVVMSGNIAVPLNVHMTKSELAPCLIKSDALTVVSSEAFRPLLEDIRLSDIPGLRIITADGRCDDAPLAPAVSPDEIIALLATSGTTGRPKLVQLSERNITASQYGYAERMHFDEIGWRDKKMILAVPFSSAYGIMIICVCLMRGYPIVVMNDGFTLADFYRTVERYSVTNYEGSASVVTMMVQTAGRNIPYDISSLSHIGFGGSKMSGRVIERCQQLYPDIKLYQGYGMTEAAPMITKFDCRNPIKPDSVGTAVRGVDVRICAAGKITRAANVKGEVLVSGANVTSGYYKDKEATDKAIKNGFLYTGDIGYLDGEGYLYICGRKKNLIIVRGLKVNPEEVEECITESGLAAECMVYGKTDEWGGESVCADVVPSLPGVTAEDIKFYCCGRLSPHKQPGTVRLCGSIKKNASGKTQRPDGGK